MRYETYLTQEYKNSYTKFSVSFSQHQQPSFKILLFFACAVTASAFALVGFRPALSQPEPWRIHVWYVAKKKEKQASAEESTPLPLFCFFLLFAWKQRSSAATHRGRARAPHVCCAVLARCRERRERGETWMRRAAPLSSCSVFLRRQKAQKQATFY